MVELVRTPKPVNLEEADVITLADAARLSNRSLPSIGVMLDRGTLPWYEYPAGVPGKSGARYTSKAAVLQLPKDKARGTTARKAKK